MVNFDVSSLYFYSKTRFHALFSTGSKCNDFSVFLEIEPECFQIDKTSHKVKKLSFILGIVHILLDILIWRTWQRCYFNSNRIKKK